MVILNNLGWQCNIGQWSAVIGKMEAGWSQAKEKEQNYLFFSHILHKEYNIKLVNQALHIFFWSCIGLQPKPLLQPAFGLRTNVFIDKVNSKYIKKFLNLILRAS